MIQAPPIIPEVLFLDIFSLLLYNIIHRKFTFPSAHFHPLRR